MLLFKAFRNNNLHNAIVGQAGGVNLQWLQNFINNNTSKYFTLQNILFYRYSH